MSVISDKSTDDNSCPIFKDLLAVNQPVYVNAHFTSGSSSFYNKSLLDIGSDICLISHAVLLKNKLVGSMFGEGQNIIGVSNKPITSLGFLKFENIIFPDILFDVMEQIPVPILIGKSLSKKEYQKFTLIGQNQRSVYLKSSELTMNMVFSPY